MKNKRNLCIISLVVLNIILDQLSKFWIRGNVAPYNDINIIADYFIITNVENSGAFLGLGSDFSPVIKSILLLALPVGVLVTVLVYVFKDKSIDKLSLIGYSSIIGGGIGNIYDRFLYGSVTDFLFIDLGGVFKTGIFNIADLSVTTGMILIIWASFKNKD
ncbi:signal peptidase II [Flavobacteriaceae bacterium]|jgi:signal peptidase II|nr:signal peptidase II [bacterium]MDA9067526.1 signal peptidase II [Flavobacteriaceae bacterium]MDA9284660.1 signal peptidase II [Flavobacteriaceae bacterium]MDC0622804.1 signal peptidase II [Flavobacteriaceae bacterium]MDC1109094.1 signal peptidase II [Flavobacteriaceae bacterium]|tara:strand:+ start:1099 stop:1581 length:483 start_codon:yes stop_codon:yes gene_type:complete